jgi:iron(III) transport system substrate-binding protein
MISEIKDMNIINRFSSIFIVLLGIFLLTSCVERSSDQLVVYSGRSQALVAQLVKDFKEQTGADVEVRYGNDAELLAVMEEEGEQSPADIYWANTTGALANASQKGMLVPLPDSLVNKPYSYTSSSGEWLPITVRFRVLAYNPQNIDPDELPESVMDLPKQSEFEGRVGWTPTYSSFYDFMTTMRLLKGDEEAKNWVEGMKELNPKSYSSNTPMVQAIAAGEIDLGLTNHYYVLRMKEGGEEGEFEDHEEYGETGPDPNATIEMYHFASGDVGNLALVTGASVLQNSDDSELAHQFLNFLISEKAQQYAAEAVHEYPVVRNVSVPGYMIGEDEAFDLSPEYDYEQLRQLEGTLNLLREAGLI